MSPRRKSTEPKPPELTQAERVQEARWLTDNGMTPLEAAAVLGRSVSTLELQARAEGDKELASLFGAQNTLDKKIRQQRSAA